MQCPCTKRWMTFLAVPLLISLACNTLTNTVPSGAETRGPSADAVEAFINADVVYGAGPFILPDPKAGLAELSSYTATLTLNYDGTRDGNAEKWSKTYVMLATQDPAARQLTIETVGETSNPGAVFMAEMDGMDYEKLGEEVCSSTPIEQGNSLSDRLQPAAFLNFVVGADEAGSDTVNDVAANHYAFDELALGQQDVTESTGELWVATEGGYVVKYLLSSEGKSDFFGEGIEGTINFDYELTDVNQPVEIKLPTDCPPGLVDAPPLPDAKNVVNAGGVLTFTTATGLSDAVAFYQKQLPDLGWIAQGDPSISDTGALLFYTRAGKKMTVVIDTGDTGTRVDILVADAAAGVVP